MRNTITAALLLMVLFISSCTSPEQRGNKLGVKFCNSLGDIKKFKTSFAISVARDSCNNIIKVEMQQAETDYKNDANKWNDFYKGFDNATERTLLELKNTESTLIYSELYGKLWVKENEKNPDYVLLSFGNGAIKLINTKGEVNFKLYGDSVVLDDSKNSSGAIRIGKEGKLTLSTPQSSCTYHVANGMDSLSGRWSIRGGMDLVDLFYTDIMQLPMDMVYEGNRFISFNPSGTCTLYDSYNNKRTADFTFTGGILAVKGGKDKIKRNGDKFIFGQGEYSKMRGAKPDDYKFLFVTEK